MSGSIENDIVIELGLTSNVYTAIMGWQFVL